MSAGSAPSPRCGGLDRLDRRWSSGCLRGRVGPGLGPGHRSSSLSRCPRVGSQPSLRWSRQARPAVVERVPARPGELGAGTGPPLIEPVEMSAGSAPSLRCGGLDRLDRRWSSGCLPGRVSPGLGPGHRSSSLSRCPQGRLPALVAVVSTGSTGGGSSGCLRGRVSSGLGPGHRSSSLSRCPQGRLPALVAVVSTGSTGGGRAGACRGRVSRGWDRATAHRACRDVRGSAPSLRCGGLDRLDRRWSSGCLSRPGEPGLGPGRRSSSLSRCPQGRLPALAAVVSTGSTGGGRAGACAAG